METVNLHIDRIEEGIAVAFDDGEKEYRITVGVEEICEGDMVSAEIDDLGNVKIIAKDVCAAEDKRDEFRRRLKKMFTK